MKRIHRLALAGLVALVAGGLGAPAYAAAFTVNSTSDAPDAIPGNGVCQTAGGACTLRAALQEANALAGADTVTVPAGTFVLTLGRLVISSDVTVTGAGSAQTFVDGSGTDSVFQVLSGTVALSSLTVRNGGGPTGSAILNAGTLTVTSSVVTNSGNPAVNGGGISNTGTLTVNSSQVTGNRGLRGGGIVSPPGSSVTVNDSAITGNTAATFGGGLATGGPLTVNRSIISGNTAADGGGFAALNLTLTQSEVSGNSAQRGGGVAMSDGTISNSTISTNTASVFGGGVVLQAGPFARATAINFTTIAFNVAPAGQGASLYTASGVVGNPVTVTYHDTIFQDTPAAAGNCHASVNSTMTSTGHNLSSDNTCPLGAAGDLPNTLALLGPLQNNGGPTRTHALIIGSPAINAAGPCPPPASDQRLFARPVGPACDIGAFEAVPLAIPPTPTPTGLPVAGERPGLPPVGPGPWLLLILVAVLGASLSAAGLVAGRSPRS